MLIDLQIDGSLANSTKHPAVPPPTSMTLEEALIIKKLKEEKPSHFARKFEAARKAGFTGTKPNPGKVWVVPFLLQAPLDTPEKLQAVAGLPQPPSIHRTTTVETTQPTEISFCMLNRVALDRLEDYREDGHCFGMGPRILLDGKVRMVWMRRPVGKDG